MWIDSNWVGLLKWFFSENVIANNALFLKCYFIQWKFILEQLTWQFDEYSWHNFLKTFGNGLTLLKKMTTLYSVNKNIFKN